MQIGKLEVFLMTVLLGACHRSPDTDPDFSGSAESGGPDESSSSGPATGDPGSSGGDGGDGSDESASDEAGDVKFDMPPVDPPEPSDGCHKVDFLFVIDNSVSMSVAQDSLLASFPEFMNTVEHALDTTDDFHIMVVDTDAETRCTEESCTMMPKDLWVLQSCNAPANGYACQFENFEACDTILGAGVVHPAGRNASNEKCHPTGGNRYIVQDEQALVDTFTCMATVGEAGDSHERPMDAMLTAVSEPLNETGGCNEGFLRDDAILVVTFISNDPFYDDFGTPEYWHAELVNAKNGKDNDIVVLGLGPTEDCMETVFQNPDAGKHWKAFAESFGDSGLYAAVCEPSYADFFATAVNLVDATCEQWEPEG